ncbi:hypothetical protein IY145_06390 [Methylosinus sp. H3A]|uniref:hypothetical protein n=1 Tax=Methylosinus sp. H3A TaxID=2785786 RepID=UPI0018C26B44|nr:hypothetical protein [Methylosinus sp. H3A]MBG0809000.1 hypothetical protein [Methylosinus sp. H3A]
MVKIWPRLRWMARALVSNGIAGLFLTLALAIVFSASGRAEFASPDAGASLASAAELCRSVAHDGGPAPTPADGRHHCDMCPAACDGSAQNAAVAPARRVDALAPRSATAPLLRLAEAPALFPSGWTSSWSSRAPPLAP